MAKQIQNIAVNTDYVEGEGKHTIVIRLIQAAIDMLPNDHERMRVLLYHQQKINDQRIAENESAAQMQMQEVPNGPAR